MSYLYDQYLTNHKSSVKKGFVFVLFCFRVIVSKTYLML